MFIIEKLKIQIGKKKLRIIKMSPIMEGIKRIVAHPTEEYGKTDRGNVEKLSDVMWRDCQHMY